MSSVSNVADANSELYASLGLTNTQQPTDSGDLGLDTFLTLMITQLNNQDPFEPMDNGDFLGQIAQFGTVSGIDSLNSSFDQLSGSLVSGQALQAGGLVGREVLAPIDVGYLQTGDSISGQVDLDASSSDLVVQVTDPAGQLVRELHLGPQDAGPVHFNWDGINEYGDYAPAGYYSVAVQAVRNGISEQQSTYLFANVDSVSLGANGTSMTLNLQNLGPVAFEQITQIL